MEKSSHAVPRPPGGAFKAMQLQQQFLRPQAQALALTAHRRERAALQPFCAKDQT